MIKLRVRCIACDGTGAYRSPADPAGVPCWGCEGKGWKYEAMREPESKWARQYQTEKRRLMKVKTATQGR